MSALASHWIHITCTWVLLVPAGRPTACGMVSLSSTWRRGRMLMGKGYGVNYKRVRSMVGGLLPLPLPLATPSIEARLIRAIPSLTLLSYFLFCTSPCAPVQAFITMSTAYYQYQPTTSLPVAIPGKQTQQTLLSRHNRNLSAYSQLSASPPERPESISTSSGAGLYSSASSNYAGSEYDSSTTGATSVDLLDYMNDRLSQAYNPIPLDQNLVKQAQM